MDITILVSIFIGLIVGNYLPSYFREKGKNLATKEDISLITESVEKIKAIHSEKLQEIVHQNNLFLEMQRSHNQLKFVVPDKRIQAHQEAFELWRKIIANMHSDKFVDVVLECQDWYNKNCLYLDPTARKAFSSAYNSLAMHKTILQDRSNVSEAKTNYYEMMNAGEIILNGVDLPPLTTDTNIVTKSKTGELTIETPFNSSDHT